MNISDNRKIIIAIDGFSSSGKSTFARAIASRLGYIFIDTGAMYRAVTLSALENGVFSENGFDVKKLVELLPGMDITFRHNPLKGCTEIYLNGKVAEERIRSIEVSDFVSRVSAVPEVRQKLVVLQRDMGRERGVVMEGRDIGTVVLPNAQCKIYLTASVEERAKRRMRERGGNGLSQSLDEIMSEIAKRDFDDTNRENSPMRPAVDSINLDTTNMNLDEVVDAAARLVENAISITADTTKST